MQLGEPNSFIQVNETLWNDSIFYYPKFLIKNLSKYLDNLFKWLH